MFEINKILKVAVENKASDVIFTEGRKVIFKIAGRLMELDGIEKLTILDLERYLYPLLEKRGLKEKFLSSKEIDFSYDIFGLGRFRVNCFWQRGRPGAVFRLIPSKVPSFSTLGLPAVVKSFIDYPKGLVLITGPTGSGKSTTLASLIDLINETKALHIITLEDPIEFVYEHKKSVIEQREIGEDTQDFKIALRHILRQAPDVILIGEMRDLETMSAALTIAETGHLVLATLHTVEAAQTVDRIISAFPSDSRNEIRIQLSMVLQAILSQQLIPTLSRKERVVATEVMIVNDAIRSLIREGKTHQLYSVIQSSGNVGSQTMNQSLLELIKKGIISKTEAFSATLRPDELEHLLENLPFNQNHNKSMFNLDNREEKEIVRPKIELKKEEEPKKDKKIDHLDIDFDLKI